MHTIYWIKLKQHSNILTEGYVGISVNALRRFEEHKTAKTVVGNNIRKYINDIEIVIVEKFEDKTIALAKEKELRPKNRIGWNIAIGGQIPPDNKDNENIKKKISNTLKRNGANPYSEKTHSPESIAKAHATKQKANRKMYHDPITGDYKFIAIGLNEQIPDGWVPGRIVRQIVAPRIRGVDYVCNTKEVIVIDPYGNEYNVINLKSWCVNNSIPYLAACKNKYWKGWKVLC